MSGRLDVLVNNAGIGPISPFDDLRVAEWEDMIDINIKAVLYGIAAALPVFRKQGSGISSTPLPQQDIRPYRTQAVYSGTISPCAPSLRVCARRLAINCA